MTDSSVIHFTLSEGNWESTAEFGGGECIIYRSPDQTRVAAAFKESGSHSFEYPFDEFVYVIKGSAKVAVHGGDEFVIKAGDVMYVKEGSVIDFTMDDDFMDVTFLVSDKPVKWR